MPYADKRKLRIGLIGLTLEAIAKGDLGLATFPTGDVDPTIGQREWETFEVEAFEAVREKRDVIVTDNQGRIKEHTPTELSYETKAGKYQRVTENFPLPVTTATVGGTRIRKFLTLYLQRRWYTDPRASLAVGRTLLPGLLPADEAGGYDYDDSGSLTAGTTGTQYFYFLAPLLLKDTINVKGTGFLTLRLGTWTLVSGGTITINSFQPRIYLRPDYATALGAHLKNISWSNTLTTETIRDYHVDLEGLDFSVKPTDQFELEVAIAYTTLTQAGEFYLRYARGYPESYLMLPLVEE